MRFYYDSCAYKLSEVICGLGVFFFFNETAATEIYTLSLHDALPILAAARRRPAPAGSRRRPARRPSSRDRKSTRLNSSHLVISYAVFCLKKKKSPNVSFARSTYKLNR